MRCKIIHLDGRLGEERCRRSWNPHVNDAEILHCRMNSTGINAGVPDQWRMTIKEKWLFRVAPIILNGADSLTP
jgi:hypothetical protein